MRIIRFLMLFLIVFGTSALYEDLSAQAIDSEQNGEHLTPNTNAELDLEYESIGFSTSAVTSNTFYRPVPKSAIVTCVYGNSCYSGHTGIDFSYSGVAYENQKIYSSAAGKVTEVNTHTGGYGKHIVITHNNGYKTRYGHLRSFNVSKGDIVYTGQIIGMQGSTGNSTGPHLHFEIIKSGEFTNVNYIADRPTATPLENDIYTSSYHSNGSKKRVIEYNYGNLRNAKIYTSDGKIDSETLYYNNGKAEWIIDYRSTGGRYSVKYYNSNGEMTKELRYYADGQQIEWMINYRTTGGRFDVKYYSQSNDITKEIRYLANGTSFDWIIDYKNSKRYHLVYYNAQGKVREEYRYNPDGVTLDYIKSYSADAAGNTKPYKVNLYDAKGKFINTEYYASQYTYVLKFKHSNGNDYYVGFNAGEGVQASGILTFKPNTDRVFFYKYNKVTKRFVQPSGTINKGTEQIFTEWHDNAEGIVDAIHSAKEYAYVVKFRHSNGYDYYIGFQEGEGLEAAGTLKMKLKSDRTFFYSYDSISKKFSQPSGVIKKDQTLAFTSWFDDTRVQTVWPAKEYGYDWILKFRHANGHDYYVGFNIGEGVQPSGTLKFKPKTDRPFFYKYDAINNNFIQQSGTLNKDVEHTFTDWFDDLSK